MLGYRIQDTAPEGYWYAGADINMRRLLQRSAADKMASWLIAMASCRQSVVGSRQSAVPWLPVSDQCLSMLCGVPKTHPASTPTSNIHNPKKKKSLVRVLASGHWSFVCSCCSQAREPPKP